MRFLRHRILRMLAQVRARRRSRRAGVAARRDEDHVAARGRGVPKLGRACSARGKDDVKSFPVVSGVAVWVGCGEPANRIDRDRCGSFVTASYVCSLKYGPDAEVVAPVSLREEMKIMLQLAVGAYQS